MDVASEGRLKIKKEKIRLDSKESKNILMINNSIENNFTGIS
jgi:hypothetical protein